MEDAPLAVDPLAAARGFADELRARAEEIEAARRLPRDLSDRFAAAGLYRMCVPEVYGGLELPPRITLDVIETLARADGSCAWCVFIGATTGSVLASLPPEGAREIFSRAETLMGGTYAPMGHARPADGGFRVEGRWAWGSGTANADWILGGCRVEGDEPGADGRPPPPRLLIARAEEVELLDTWHVAGLSGTGSTDFAFHDVFVPDRRALRLGVDRPLARPLYAFPAFGLLAMGIAAVTLGLARAAIDALVELADAKTPQGSTRSLARRPAAQSDVARAQALVRSARAFLHEAVGDAWDAACREGALGIDHRRDLRLATTHAVRSAARAVDLMYHLAGGSSVYRRSPLQRIFRDVHVATQHAMVAPSTLEVTGRLLLGLETDTSTL